MHRYAGIKAPLISKSAHRLTGISIQQQYAALNTLLEGGADNSEILSYVEEMIADGRPCKGMPEALFWGYDEPENMPGDARVDFFYIPTYLNTAFLIQAFRMIPGLIRERIPDFEEKLARAMTACSGRGFSGHGYDNTGFVRGMQIFASVRTKEFIRNHRETVPKVFRSSYWAALRSIERDVFDEEGYLRRIENSWECNRLEEYRRILAMENTGRHTLFVYGSLMRGGYNHLGFMADAAYLGSATITGFDLYNLGYYPGIKHTKEQHIVRGELYDVSVPNLTLSVTWKETAACISARPFLPHWATGRIVYPRKSSSILAVQMKKERFPEKSSSGREEL